MTIQGRCQDTARVYYHPEELEGKKGGIAVQHPSLFISETSFIALYLTTCHRRLLFIRDQNFGIEAQTYFVGMMA